MKNNSVSSEGERCPFSVGQFVVYKPSWRGLALDVMASEKLTPGKTYKIIEVQQDRYVVLEGYSHPGGGLHWTEFERQR